MTRLVSPLLLLLLQTGRSARYVKIAGEDLDLTCHVEPDLGGLIVWKHGARVLFAGNLQIRRDERLALEERR